MTDRDSSDFGSLHQWFLSLEDDLNLFELTVDGVPVWERVRSPVFRRLQESQDDIGQGHSEADSGLKSQLRGLSLLLRNLAMRNPFLGTQRDFLFWGHQRRKQMEDGLWWDIYCDYYTDELDLDYVHIETPHLIGHERPTKTGNLRYLDLVVYTRELVRRLGLISKELPINAHEVLTTVEDRIADEYGASIDVTGIAERKLTNRCITKPLYDRLLERVDPDISVLVVSYGKETFIEACRDRGVPTVELQHGVVNKYHLGYSYPDSRTKRDFPDYFFSFGDFWTRQVELPIPAEHVRNVGYPHLERGVERYSDVAEREQIIFVSQGSIGEHLSKMAVELSERSDVDHRIVYKLHPGEYDRWRDEYPWLADAGLEVVDDSERSLYELFAASNAQVGVSSTAVFEGLEFGLDTFVVDLPRAREYMEGLIEDDYCTVVKDAHELAEGLDGADHRRPAKTDVFAEDAVGSFRHELDAVADTV